MPEYLSPGVYIEEIPARLKAIEGVSTSTAAFVGPAERGPVAGLDLPFEPTDGFTLPIDPALVLITSFGEFTRQFGNPLPLPTPLDSQDNGYLAYAVRAFFENGGRRCYIVRVVDATTAARSSVRLQQGIVLRLARPARSGDENIVLNSLRGIDETAGLQFFRRDGSDLPAGGGPLTVSSYDTLRNSVTLSAPLVENLDPDEVYLRPAGGTLSANGPQFFARTPGTWSARVSIHITPADRVAVPVTAGAESTSTTIQVQSASSFYRGAIVEVDDGSSRRYHEVAQVNGTVLTLGAQLGADVTTDGFVRVMEIDVVIDDESGTAPTEVYRGLSWNQGATADLRRHYATQINARSRLVYVQPPGTGTPALAPAGSEAATLATQPTTTNGYPQRMTTVGNDGLPAAGAGGDDDYVGTDGGPGNRTGIQALSDSDEIRIVAAPGKTTAAVHNALITQCSLLRYRFAVLDGGEAEPVGGSVASILAHRNLYDTSYAAYYTPWIETALAGQTVYLPPSGYVAGIYARSDTERGVHKAPANEVVRGATGLRSYITAGEQDVLNPRGVNVIRRFEGRGIRVWGARTLSSDPEFRYVNVRRFLIFLGASIDRGTQYVVFEPNTPDTWSRVVDSVSAFLHTQWRNGALFGRRPEDAYLVRCDESTMTADDVQNGRLICEIGVAIVRPAEFVIFRIEQITGFARST